MHKKYLLISVNLFPSQDTNVMQILSGCEIKDNWIEMFV